MMPIQSLPTERKPLQPIALLGLLVAVFLVFWGSLDNPFHYDDIHSIVDNPHIRSLARPLRFLTEPEMFSADPRQAMYRPLVVVSLAVNHAIGGYEPAGYHLFNLAVHAANALLVLALARLWGLGMGGALGAAALFGFHPVNVESLNLISSRSESLCALFFLATFICYLKSRGQPRGWYWAALALYAGSLSAKAVGITLPAVLLVYELWVGKRPFEVRGLVQRQGPFWLIALGYLAVVRGFVATAVVDQPVRPLTAQLWTQAKALVYYLKMLFLPHSLSIEHQFRVSEQPAEGAVLTALAVVLTLGLGGLWGLRTERRLVFWLLWALLVLLPTLLVPLNILVNEHRLYLPTVGFAVGLGLLFERWRWRWGAWGGIGMLVLLAVLARQRTEVWQTAETLWADARQKGPLMPRPYIYEGDALRQAGQHQESLAAYEQAATVNPQALSGMDWVVLHNNRGSTWMALGQIEKAIDAYRQALALDPQYTRAQQALEALTAMAQRPWVPQAEVLYKQAMVHLVAAQLDQAVAGLQQALEVQEQPEIYIALGLAHERRGDWAGARQAYITLIERFPGTALVRTAERKLAALEGGA